MDSNVVSLRDFLDNHNINKVNDLKELENIFYMMDLEMKKLHSYNYYVNDFSVYNIFVSNTRVIFNGVSLMDNEDKEHYINNNIYYLACLELGIYCDILGYMNPNNKEYFRDNFNDLNTFLPEEVSLYYKGIFVNDLRGYLSDFINKRKEIDNSSYNDNGNNKSIGVSLSKSTFVGRMMSESDKKNAAFIRIILFPFIILFLSILIPLMVILES